MKVEPKPGIEIRNVPVPKVKPGWTLIKIKACGICGSCLRIAQGQSESMLEIRPDGQFIKVSQASEIINYLSLQQWGRARAVIIDDVQRMNMQAANSLLKTLEEPPERTYFFLLTINYSMLIKLPGRQNS